MRFGKLPVLLIPMALVAAACGSGGDDAADGGGPVVVYSGRSEELIQPILDDFEAETGIEVSAPRYGGSDELALLLDEEGDSTPADVFISQSPGAVGFLEEQGVLAELPENVLSLVDESVRDDDNRWVGISGRQRVLVYNTDAVEAAELPSSIFDLTDPAWKGRIGIAPGNGSFQDFVSLMRTQVGDDAVSEWLDGLVANDVQTYAKNSAIVAAVGRGEVDAGLVNHYYNYRAIDEDPNHKGLNHQLAVDDPGSVLIVTGAAVLADSNNKTNAEKLVEYLLSESAQRYFADETFEYPLANGVSPSRDIPAAPFAEVGSVDFGDLGDSLASTRELIEAAGLEG